MAYALGSFLTGIFTPYWDPKSPPPVVWARRSQEAKNNCKICKLMEVQGNKPPNTTWMENLAANMQNPDLRAADTQNRARWKNLSFIINVTKLVTMIFLLFTMTH